MIVCLCNRVSDREITHLARIGMDFETIQAETDVAGCCGRCEHCARQLVQQCRPSHPVAALQRAEESPLRCEV